MQANDLVAHIDNRQLAKAICLHKLHHHVTAHLRRHHQRIAAHYVLNRFIKR
jgi:hypothetical protein